MDLYGSIIRELWPLSNPSGKVEPRDHILYVVWFCRHMPSILGIVADLQKHLRDEFTWTDHAQLMREAVSRDKENIRF